MSFKNLSITALATLCLLAVGSGSAWAHGDAPRVPEGSTADARMFIADGANGDLVTVDLPSGEVVSRLTTPRYIMSVALSSDQRHLFMMRGRGTDRDFITIVNTGVEPGSNMVMPPYVARTIPGETPGPGDENRMVTVGGKDALMLEGPGEFLVLNDDAFTGLAPIPARTYQLAAPDHYFYLEASGNLYLGHLRKGYIQVINRETGEEVALIKGCPLTHGKGMDKESGRLFYACMRDIVVIGTRGDELNQIVARIPYPVNQRVGAFYHGAGRVMWAYTEGTLPIIYRLDAGKEPYELEVVDLDPSIRQWSAQGGEYLLSLARSGMFEIRSGDTGEILRTVRVCEPFDAEFHEHVDKAVLPDIKSLWGDAYISLPPEGRIVVVDLETGEIERSIEVGGEPTRIVLVDVKTDAAQAASASN